MGDSGQKELPRLEEVLDDLCTRFLVNLPDEEFKSFERLFFAVESAHWFYDDFYRERDGRLPRLQLKSFARKLFDHTPLLQPYAEDFDQLFKQFRDYKQDVPTYGAAMLNAKLDKVLLVRGWGSGAKWGFPKGKMGNSETELQAAVREVLEETGFDLSEYVDDNTYYVDSMLCGRFNRIYVVPNISEDAKFETQTRKEISKIDWVPLSDLPIFRKSKPKYDADDGPSPAKQKAAQKAGEKGGGQIPHNKFVHVAPYTTRIRDWVKRERNRRSKQRKQAAVAAMSGGKTKEAATQGAAASSVTTMSGGKVKEGAARAAAAGSVATMVGGKVKEGATRAPKGSPTRGRRSKKDRRRGDTRDVMTFGKDGGALTQAERDDLFEQYVRDADRRTRELRLDDDNWARPPMAIEGMTTTRMFTFDRDAIVAKMLAA